MRLNKRYQDGGGVPSGDPPKFGIARNVLERLGTYGKTRQQAEQDPYYEGRYDISKDDVFDFLIRNFRDSMNDQQKADMLNQMASVKELEEGKPVYKSVTDRGHFDSLRNRAYLPEHRKSSAINRGSIEAEEFIHGIQQIMEDENLSDYGITEENVADFLPGGKEDLPNRYMPFMRYRKGDPLKALSKEVEELVALNPDGISDDGYYGGAQSVKETEAMLFSGLMHLDKMGVIPVGQTITEQDIPEIIRRLNSLESKSSTVNIPDHARRLKGVLENIPNLKPGSMELLLKILNQDMTISGDTYPQSQSNISIRSAASKNMNGGKVIRYRR